MACCLKLKHLVDFTDNTWLKPWLCELYQLRPLGGTVSTVVWCSRKKGVICPVYSFRSTSSRPTFHIGIRLLDRSHGRHTGDIGGSSTTRGSRGTGRSSCRGFLEGSEKERHTPLHRVTSETSQNWLRILLKAQTLPAYQDLRPSHDSKLLRQNHLLLISPAL